MASTKKTLTRTAYTSLGSGATVNVALPKLTERADSFDRVELVIATSSPTVPTPNTALHELALVMENSRDGIGLLTGITVGASDTLYARWVGPAQAGTGHQYVVTF